MKSVTNKMYSNLHSKIQLKFEKKIDWYLENISWKYTNMRVCIVTLWSMSK